MSLSQIKDELKKIGIPMAYYQFTAGTNPKLPYIVYYENSIEARGADSKPCISESEIIIELYSGKINLQIEEKIKDCLKKSGISFELNREWIEKENMWETLFKFQIIHKEEVK